MLVGSSFVGYRPFKPNTALVSIAMRGVAGAQELCRCLAAGKTRQTTPLKYRHLYLVRPPLHGVPNKVVRCAMRSTS